jgi:hypothetical protein
MPCVEMLKSQLMDSGKTDNSFAESAAAAGWGEPTALPRRHGLCSWQLLSRMTAWG